MYEWPLVVLAGFAIGLLMGFFGVGGASVATPLLSLLGVPPLAAVASPLPATIPGAAIAGVLLPAVGRGPAPGRGVVARRWHPGDRFSARSRPSGSAAGALLVASGVVLVVVGIRIIRPIDDEARAAGTRRRLNRPLLVAATAGVGFLTGLLANGGGFLLVPLYVLFFGLRMRPAVGTSLVVVSRPGHPDARHPLDPGPRRLGRGRSLRGGSAARQRPGQRPQPAGGGVGRAAGVRLVPRRLRRPLHRRPAPPGRVRPTVNSPPVRRAFTAPQGAGPVPSSNVGPTTSKATIR